MERMPRDELERLFVLYFKDVSNVAYFYTHNTEDAQDVAIDTFIKAWELNPKTDTNIKAYLLKTATSLSFDKLRKKRTIIEYDDGLGGAEESELDFELAEAISRLPRKLGLSITLVFLYGFSTKEASRILGCSETAVRKRLERGKQELKRLLGEK